MKTTHSMAGRTAARVGGFPVALFLATACLLSPRARGAYTEFQAWDSAHEFHMIIDVQMDPATQAVKIMGGRIEFRGATGNYMMIEQAQGKKAPKPAPKKMAGVVMYSQTGGSVTASLFTGSLVGDLANGTLTATGVSFEAYNQAHTGLTFVMVNGNGGGGGGGGGKTSVPPPAAPGTLAPVGLTAAQVQAIAKYNADRNKPITKAPTSTSPTPSTAPSMVYLDNSNSGGVTQMAGTKRPNFFSRVPIHVTEIWTYHWNNGRGAAPGTISIICSNGTTYGPWRAQGSAGQGGAPNVNWTVYPNVQLPAGGYTIVDSSPETWSENTASHECGFTKVTGHP